MRPLFCTQGFSKIWYSDLVFNPTMIQFQTWPRFHGDKHIDNVSWRLVKLWPLECTQAKFFEHPDVRTDARTTDDGQQAIPNANLEHFVPRWAKNECPVYIVCMQRRTRTSLFATVTQVSMYMNRKTKKKKFTSVLRLSKSSCVRLIAMTFAPHCASFIAIPRPMPRDKLNPF